MAEKNRRPVPVKKKKPRTKLTPTDEEKLKLLLAERAQLAEEMARLKARTDEINAEAFDIVQTLDGADETWEGADDSGHYHRATIVRPKITQYDEEELQRQLPPSVWYRITDRVLNVRSLENEVVDGKVNADLVQEAMSISERKPYIRITTK